MTISRLLNGVRVICSKMELNFTIEKPFSDSRKAINGGAFVAIKGEKRNGNDYIMQVIEKGAKCIITDDYESYNKNPRTILVENARKALAFMWDNYYDNPTKDMSIVAITGTNGKTSCAYYLYNILKEAEKKRGLISTVECLINDDKYETNGGSAVPDIIGAMTTPDPEILYSIFDKMRLNGVEVVVMEASSHALEQDKLSPLSIKVGAFTNLSSEHMDFHANMEKYYLAKRKLFELCEYAVINTDDEYGKRAASEIKCKVVTCSVNFGDCIARDIKLSSEGYTYKFCSDNLCLDISGHISTRFSIYNTNLSIAMALILNIDKRKIKDGILNTKSIKGRLERVENTNIFIDYAHTPCAINGTLKSLREIFPKKRIIALFGCGGDRDREKREKMAKTVFDGANMAIITADNSRNESICAIFRDILKGVPDGKDFVIISKRRSAIKYALSIMQNDDVLILLGKGHESYEIDKNGMHYFNERQIIEEVLGIVQN